MRLPQDRPALMGILNVTPDSFSDGGLHYSPQDAIDAGLRMTQEGADLIDVGGESTRPGAIPVSLDEELRRVLPVIEALVSREITVSIDTMKPGVAREALAAGARVVNDVSGFRDPEMMEVCVEGRATVCVMHMRGVPQSMQMSPQYEDVVGEVKDFLVGAAKALAKQGLDRSRIWIDPGIGFGKTDEHNLTLIRHLPELVSTGMPVLLGVSRKGFVGRALAQGATPLTSDQRLEGTLATQVFAQLAGVKIIRSHDVRASRRAIEMTRAITTER